MSLTLTFGGVEPVATHSLTEFGAVTGTDCTAAFTSALSTCGAGDVLLVPHGIWKLGASTGGITFPDGLRMIGLGRKSSIIECNYGGTTRVKMMAPAGYAAFSDLGFTLGASVDRAAVPIPIFGQATATRITLDRVDFIGGLGYCLSTWQDVVTDMYLRDVVFDGQLAGLASGANRQVAMGVTHNGGGRIVMDNCEFSGLGSNATDKPYSSHCVYIAPTVTLLASKCRFSSHIQGRMIQFYNGFVVTPPAIIGPDVIRDCEFGPYNAAVNPYTMCETSEVKPTTYASCHWAAQTCTSGATVNTKGTCYFPNSRFDGSSPYAGDYLGDVDGVSTGGVYDARGAYFGEVRQDHLTETITVKTYGSSMTPIGTSGSIQKIVPTNTSAFTINAVNGQLQAGAHITFDIGGLTGTMGTITWNAVYKLAGSFTNPASTKRRLISFYYDGTNWVETFRSAADI